MDDTTKVAALVLVIPVGAALFLLITWPIRVANYRQHPASDAIQACALFGLLFFPLWIVALIWAYSRPAINTSSDVRQFRVEGIDRDSKMETLAYYKASSPAKAKARAELDNILVTDCYEC